MKLLVTGGLGFIGSNFILNALENYPGLKITNVDAELLGSNRENTRTLKNNKNYQYIKADINNKNAIEKIVDKNDAVINFAAESHVDRSIFDSKPFLKSNIMGVYTILDVIRKKKSKTRFVQISTDEVFGSLKIGRAKEKDVFRPSNPYSASKASAELICKSYVSTYNLDIVISRCTNNFGPRQFPEKLIPKTIIRAEKNMKVPIYGNGNNIRDWLYVEDHCEALMKILLDGKSGESYNISSLDELSNIKLVKKILELLGKSKGLIYFVDDRPGHDFRYGLDSSKIRKMGWKPKRKFNEDLQSTISWYMQNKNWWNKLITPEMLDPTPWKKYRKIE